MIQNTTLLTDTFYLYDVNTNIICTLQILKNWSDKNIINILGT